MPLSRKIAPIAALALATLVPAGIANAAPAPAPELQVPIGQAVHIDHVLTDTHIMSSHWRGDAASNVQLFEDYDSTHGAGEKWIFRATGLRDQVRIENSGGQYCLQPGDPANAVVGTQIVQRTCSTGSKAQRWTLESNGTTAEFTIRPYEDDSLAITPATNDRYSTLRLGQTDGPGHINQLFRIRYSDL
ncbi:hypothetical protein SSP24_33040 [Streptomyces spinoverrucosus]|uniref:Ricin B lectin domain-containing protein n=1 Tax=Streptomyces spinoverrucosus TaxID=284043 RepID=A0A4Y3VJ74_9ACTN|nr:RICIN domain-containing protein [Streptomyces spinoverrucosus]GEC05649.1 hypothetical protein SSP24_33040 [Streptomyces spinoverrucosus]GHB77835.1 hypothetical protein GCM10010397_55550 [Streptomyces spinoverrucosus]